MLATFDGPDVMYRLHVRMKGTHTYAGYSPWVLLHVVYVSVHHVAFCMGNVKSKVSPFVPVHEPFYVWSLVCHIDHS